MKKLISAVFSVIFAVSSCAIPVMANDDVHTITASKTAQWTAQESGAYDGRIHGWTSWENAVYIGFELPENFTAVNLESAELTIDTISASNSGKAYLYSTDYTAFEKGGDYTGTDNAPAYNASEIAAFEIPTKAGAKSIDLLEYVSTLDNGTENVAFRIDTKSVNVNHNWHIGTLTNGDNAPVLELTYGDGTGFNIISAEEIKISIKPGGKPNLPDSVTVNYKNGKSEKASVVWEEYDAFNYDGEYRVRGTVTARGQNHNVEAVVTVKSDSIEDGYSVNQVIGYANNSGICEISADYSINTKNTDELWGFIASYDNNGAIRSIKKSEVFPNGNDSASMSIRISLDNEIAEIGTKVKTMLWRAKDMKPITRVGERVIKNTSDGNFADMANIELAENSMFALSANVGLEYVNSIDVDRLLAPSYEMHGLKAPNNAERYGGWERMGANNWGSSPDTFTLAGHSLGHWMSAAAVFYRETRDTEILDKLNYAVCKLDELQSQTGSPYIGGCEETTFTKMFAGDSDWNRNFWVPWYGIHKIYQGLIDAYYYTANPTALKVVTKFTDWAVDGTRNLSDSFIQQTLDVEYGGMNEIFAQMYEITGEEEYLNTAKRFTHNAILNPLIEGKDELTGKHANTQIPKIVGAAELYEQDPVKYADYKDACINFWDYVVNNRSYAIGGNSIGEHFEAAGAETLGVKTCESCNSYNMMRLAEHLYSWTHNVKYMDDYENILYNHILGQQDPDTGSKMYFVSLLQGHHRIYEKKDESWWCCTGTGMENPGRYTRTAYYEDGNSMYMNLYMPTSYLWKDKGLKFKVETNYPYSDKVKVIVEEGTAEATLNFRAPSWIESDMTALVNDKMKYTQSAGKYLTIDGLWKKGDVVELVVPMSVKVYESRIENQIAYKYGTITLAAQLDSLEGVSGVSEYVSNETVLDSVVQDVPYLITNGQEPASLVTRTDEDKLIFKIDGTYSSDGKDIYLKPFYDIHHHFHNVYWDIDSASGEYEKALNAVSIDIVQPDGQQDEIGHNLDSASSHNGSFTEGTKTYFWRDAYGSDDAYFGYTMKTDETAKYLFVRYWGADGNLGNYTRDFNIYIDEELLANQTLLGDKNGEYDVFYELPQTMISGKSLINVKFVPKNTECIAGGILEMRVVSDKISSDDEDEIIKNESFESELLGEGKWTFPNKGGWYIETATVAERSTAEKYSGETSVKLQSATIGQRVLLEAGYTYKLKAYLKGATAGTANIGFYDGTASWPASNPVLVKKITTTTDWQEVTLDFDCAVSKEYVVCIDTWDDTTVYVDDVTITSEKTPEKPAEIIDVSQGYTATGIFEANAGNPIIPGYIGDPYIFQDEDGMFYVYGTTDGYGTEEGGGIGGIYNGVFIDNTSPYCIWYSKDLINWQCKTLLHSNGDFPKEESVLWAPSMAKASNGKYYMAYIYKAYNCYLAEADTPLGPWRDAEGFNGEKLAIDDAVLTEKGIDTSFAENLFDSDIVTLSDGRTYLVTMGPQTGGKNTVWIGRFSEDMKSFDKFEPVFNGGVFEGPGLFERDGKYYLTFSNGSLGNGSYRVDYAMSDDLWSGYTAMGNILQRDNALSINTTGHSNSIKIGDDYYICYHRKIQVGSGGRSACIEKMEFNDDGSIKYIAPTINGARPNIANTVTEENLVWGGVYVTASSIGTSTPLGTGISGLPKYAVDRNYGTLWVASDTGKQWYQIDFGEVKDVKRIETIFEYHTVAYKYKIEYSVDGKNWTVFADKTNNTTLDCPQIDKKDDKVRARYIKMSFDEGVNVERDVPVGIFEINIY